MKDESISITKKSAEENYSSGLYCAESVVLAITKAQGIESELFPKAATAFCSGMARTCGTCGALSGAILGVSLVHGRSEAAKSVDNVYAATQKLVSTFEDEFGGKNCNELLGCDLGTPEGQAKFRNDNLNMKCEKYTSKAAEIAAQVILEFNE